MIMSSGVLDLAAPLVTSPAPLADSAMQIPERHTSRLAAVV